MKLHFLCLCCLLAGCNTAYHYYAPPMNNNSFANKNETHISGHAGITGSSAQFGFAMKNNFSLLGSYHYSSPVHYRGSEFETGLMLGKSDSSSAKKTLTLGCGFGNNYEKIPDATLKNFRGNFIKPFAMLTVGSAHKTPLLGDWVFVDVAFSIKANYLIYDGYKATTKNNIPAEKEFATNVFFTEPYFNFSIGLKWFRISCGGGLILKKKYPFDKNISMLPVEANAGLLYIIGRKDIQP